MSEEKRILIFADEISSRLVYTLDIIFESRAIPYALTNNPKSFEESTLPKLVYAHRPFEKNYLTLLPSDLLFEENIQHKKLSKEQWNNEEILCIDGVIDPLAAIFYVISCYEEYTNTARDHHNRFQAKDSLLSQFGWLEKLIVERWSLAFIHFIEEELNTSLRPKKMAFNIVPTFDIDHAFAYKNKSEVRKRLATLKDVLYFKKNRLKERKAVLSGEKEDPFDTYHKMISIREEGFSVFVFWLLGDYGKYDKNISHTNPYQIKLIKKLQETIPIGLHPSYQSNEHLNQLKIEKQRLSEILDQEVLISRQHFLKLNLPYTYINLIKNGFDEDFSLGFVDKVGFRAGVARSFNWFNLKSNKKEALIIHPIAYMDGTLKEYMKLSVAESKKKIDQLKEEVKKYGGDFLFIWHNHTIGTDADWSSWSELLDYTLKDN